VKGYIPTEAYPGGVVVLNNVLYVANIEAKGARVLSPAEGHRQTPVSAYTIHKELASLSIIPLPKKKQRKAYTKRVREQSLFFRLALTNELPREHMAPRPVPERIGEP